MKTKPRYVKTIALTEQECRLCDYLMANGVKIIDIFRKGLEIMTKQAR